MKNYCILKIAFVALFVSLFSYESEAQDPRFSQFYMAPLHNNPAMTGVFEGQFRAGVIYRNQWSSLIDENAFKTLGASFDLRQRINSGDFFAVGIDFIKDDAGDARFNQTHANLSLSFLKELGRGGYNSSNQYLIAGAKVGFGQNGLDWNKLSFSNQFDGETETFDPNNPTGETFGNETVSYADFGVGLMYYAVFDDNLSVYGGGSMQHLNQPNVSFYENEIEVLFMRWNVNLGGQVPFTEQFSVLPAIRVMGQGPSLEADFGANFRYSNNDWSEVALRAGFWGRVTNVQSGDAASIRQEAIVITAMLEMERWLFGVSYDINSSDLQAASNSRGAFEVSLIYIHPASWRSPVSCPRF